MAKPDKAKSRSTLQKNPDRKNGKKWKKGKLAMAANDYLPTIRPNGQRTRGRCKPSGCSTFGYGRAKLVDMAQARGTSVSELIDDLRVKRNPWKVPV